MLSILLVLTLLTALPLTALAMDDNSGSIGSVPAGETMTNNTGSIGTNNGTIKNNGTVDEDGTEYYYRKDDNFVGHNPNTEEVDLDELVKSYAKTGDYKLSSYTVWTYNKDSNADDKLEQQNVADTTKYSISAPTLLKLVWEKIASVVKPTEPATSSDGGEAVNTSYSRNYIGLGSVIFINEKGYKVVEIKDDAYVVVSFDALSDEDVQDLDALFAKLFTAEQREQIKNVGQLLDAEDVLTIFGKPGNHPVYEINKSLVQ